MTKSKEILDLTQQSFTSEDLPSIWEQVETEQREFVDLSYNQSTISHLNLPAHKLQSVRFLYLYQSNIESIDIDGDLPNLKILHLGGNQLKEFSLPSGFGALEYLRLDDNQLTEIDLKDLVLDNLKGKNSLKSLFLKENKVANVPQEILEQDENCLKQVQVYYKAIEDTGIGHDNEVKVILVGNGSVGKTQIAKRLEKPEENRFDTDHKSTHAIVLWQRKLKGTHLKEGLVLNIWDFGGQDIYHATHRMFMQTNALFLLVWDSKNEKDPQHPYKGRWYDNKKLDYWLKYVACFGKGSPVLLLQNKMDRAGEEEMERYDKKKYQRDYPNIKGFLKLSAQEHTGFGGLEHAIKKIYEGEPKLLEAFKKNQLPNGWLAVRNRVRAEQAKDDGGQHTIDRATFELWCREAAVSDSVEVILGFLHDTGVLFYRPAYFLGQIILNQAWAIEAVYRVFDKDNKYIYEALEEEEGLLDYYMMCTVWEEHTDKERSLFVDFMLSCELCFETTPKDKDRYRRHRKLSERTFVVPQYLPAKMPQKLKNDFTAVLELTESKKIPYHFLPKVFMHRFIVQEQDLMPDEVNRYQEDLLLKYQDAYALVSADFQERSISIRYNPNNLDFPAFIEARLDEIAQEATFKAVKGKREEKASLGNMLLQYRQKEGRNPEGDVAKTETNPTKAPAKQLFLSYSLQDKNLFNKLDKQLEILKNVGLIRTWDESDILASEKWGEVNRHKLEEADIVVLLVSSDFLADKSKWESDVLRAMQRHEKGEAKVVPVIVRPCMWEYAPFKSLKALPRSHPSVTQAPNQDEAWWEVAQEIRALLE